MKIINSNLTSSSKVFVVRAPDKWYFFYNLTVSTRAIYGKRYDRNALGRALLDIAKWLTHRRLNIPQKPLRFPPHFQQFPQASRIFPCF